MKPSGIRYRMKDNLGGQRVGVGVSLAGPGKAPGPVCLVAFSICRQVHASPGSCRIPPGTQCLQIDLNNLFSLAAEHLPDRIFERREGHRDE